MTQTAERIRMLLLEDSPGDARLALRVVERMPEPRPEVVHVVTLADALAALTREPFDLVLTDLHVPDSDGLDTCRALCDDAREPAVVVLSGSHDNAADAALALGAQDFLIKGRFNPDDLARVLRQARQRHALTQRLREAERRTRHLLGAAAVGIYSAPPDATGRISFVSDNIETLLGHQPRSFTQHQGAWIRLIHPEDRERAQRDTRTAVAAGGGATEYRFRHGDGRWVWIRDDMKVTRSASGADELVGCVSDITEHKRLEHELRLAMEAAVASNSAKSAFLSNMSHELRTPLNAVIGFAELLRDLVGGDLTPKQERWVENILTSGRHLLTLINDVLDLAKIDAGKMTLELSQFDAAAVITGVVDLVRPLAEKKQIALAFTAAVDLAQLSADLTKFKQVLYNLLANAIKFTPPGGSVSVRVETAPDGAALRVRVDDTGIGLGAENLEFIFEDFTQVEGSASRSEPGTGLGLALARRMVALHGGRIWAESAGPGAGCSVIVELPHAPLNHEPDTTVTAAERARHTVLVVEDNDLDRELVVTLLERNGCMVETAVSGEDALRMARQRPPDLVMMDIGLPGMDGLEATRRLKLEPKTAAVPVIVLSARASRADSAAALAAGAAIHIAKPFDTRTLRTVVSEILRPLRRGPAGGGKTP